LALHVTPASVDDRAAVGRIAEAVREATDNSVTLVYAAQGYTGEKASSAAPDQGIHLQVVKLPEAKRGFVLLPKRWVVERSFAWSTRCRKLVKDYERYAKTLADLHVAAIAWIMFAKAASIMQSA
jgi:transposase